MTYPIGELSIQASNFLENFTPEQKQISRKCSPGSESSDAALIAESDRLDAFVKVDIDPSPAKISLDKDPKTPGVQLNNGAQTAFNSLSYDVQSEIRRRLTPNSAEALGIESKGAPGSFPTIDTTVETLTINDMPQGAYQEIIDGIYKTAKDLKKDNRAKLRIPEPKDGQNENAEATDAERKDELLPLFNPQSWALVSSEPRKKLVKDFDTVLSDYQNVLNEVMLDDELSSSDKRRLLHTLLTRMGLVQHWKASIATSPKEVQELEWSALYYFDQAADFYAKLETEMRNKLGGDLSIKVLYNQVNSYARLAESYLPGEENEQNQNRALENSKAALASFATNAGMSTQKFEEFVLGHLAEDEDNSFLRTRLADPSGESSPTEQEKDLAFKNFVIERRERAAQQQMQNIINTN